MILAGVSGFVVLVGVAALLAFLLYRRKRRTPSGVVLLVGDSLDSSILKGLLESRHRGRVGGASEPWVRRVATVPDALGLVKTIRCAAIVVSDPTQLGRAPTDAQGRPVPVLSEQEQIESLLGRVPIDLIRGDAWRDDVLRRRATSVYPRIKRLMDVAVAVVVGILLAPVVALTGLLLLALHGRPLFIGVPCAGRDDRPFRLWYFRTTAAIDPANPPAMRQQPTSGWQLAVRRSHLDMAPNIWNVLVGDVSLIGPRPEPVAQIEQRFADLPHFRYRHLVRPGLASLAQVRFRYSDAPRDTRLALEYDLYYVKHAGPGFDTRIFLRGLLLGFADVLGFVAWGAQAGNRRIRRSIAGPAGTLAWRPKTVASVAFPHGPAGSAGSLKATLLVGSGSGGMLLAKEMRGNPDWGYWPVGYVDDDLTKVGTRVGGLPVLGTTGAVPAIVRREHIDAVVIAIPSAPDVIVNRIAELARQTTAQVLKMPHIGEALYNRQRSVILQTVHLTDVLGREVVTADTERCRDFIRGRRVLVTGAAGSIGREVARQVAMLQPEILIGLDINESDLFDLQQELKNAETPVNFRPVVASITHRKRLDRIFASMQPEIVFHAAAYKHVPMMEEYPQEAIWSNTIGTYEAARAAAAAGVERFVLVSSDKAVRPSSVMGATKRLAEIVLRSVSSETGLSACAVRFGNVLGSRGSVIPTFEKQIAAGGPVTITDPRMKRFFMTIPEAAGLIIEAGAFGDRNVMYMLDMGEEVAIKDLAERMIRLHGLRVGTDIEIAYTGLRPGEKLREELSLDFESASPTEHPKIRILSDGPRDSEAPDSAALVERLGKIGDLDGAIEIRMGLLALIMEQDGAFYDPQTQQLVQSVAAD
jgi:FlaA1/EpsC-like NDP-sugar epimerase/lipopolysaccharide/colanic/teichoic acid biosynthesis glycosyltransferase